MIMRNFALISLMSATLAGPGFTWQLGERESAMDGTVREVSHAVGAETALMIERAEGASPRLLILEQLPLSSTEVLLRVDNREPWTIAGVHADIRQLDLALRPEQWEALMNGDQVGLRFSTGEGFRDRVLKLGPTGRRAIRAALEGPSGHPITVTVPTDLGDSGYSLEKVEIKGRAMALRFPLMGRELETDAGIHYALNDIGVRGVQLEAKPKKIKVDLEMQYRGYRTKTVVTLRLLIDGAVAHETQHPQRLIRGDRFLYLPASWKLESGQIEKIDAGVAELEVVIR